MIGKCAPVVLITLTIGPLAATAVAVSIKATQIVCTGAFRTDASDYHFAVSPWR
jgi:hypothetical protein